MRKPRVTCSGVSWVAPWSELICLVSSSNSFRVMSWSKTDGVNVRLDDWGKVGVGNSEHAARDNYDHELQLGRQGNCAETIVA